MMTRNPATMQTRHGAKTVLEALDDLVRDHPQNTWWKVPKDVELVQGWRNITYAELAQAVDGMAKWIIATLGMGTKASDVVAYVGLNDVRYAVAQLGLIKAGWIVLLPSPRNSRD
jgi:acyl-CoA synthetase (AMP-forming)/AMP-acid ligase II